MNYPTTTDPATTEAAERQAGGFEALRRSHQQRVGAALERYLPRVTGSRARLHESMRYAVLNGGKRIRAMLVYWGGQAVGAPSGLLDAPACAVELVHAYSLVHDDLPCMDDDDLRRGKPTCHRAFDEATALLCGDALQSLAFELLTGAENGLTAAQQARMVLALARAIGTDGMAGGQAIDLQSVGTSLELEQLQDMHRRKTGALIEASIRLGALAKEVIDTSELQALGAYARCIGLAFQIQDDILDVEGDTVMIGKTQGADIARGKPTYPAIVGINEARRMASELHHQAIDAIAAFGAAGEPLRSLAAFVVNRRS